MKTKFVDTELYVICLYGELCSIISNIPQEYYIKRILILKFVYYVQYSYHLLKCDSGNVPSTNGILIYARGSEILATQLLTKLNTIYRIYWNWYGPKTPYVKYKWKMWNDIIFTDFYFRKNWIWSFDEYTYSWLAFD